MSILDSLKKGNKDKKKDTTKDKTKSEGLKSEKKKKDKGKSKKSVARIYSNAYRTVINPTISEKATFLSTENKYVFEVYKDANKKQISQAIKDIYGVEPVKINIINLSGKQRRYGRYTGRTKDRKKAIVTLKDGQNIQVYEGV